MASNKKNCITYRNGTGVPVIVNPEKQYCYSVKKKRFFTGFTVFLSVVLEHMGFNPNEKIYSGFLEYEQFLPNI